MSAAPGWYPDPSSQLPSTLRYFDGATWSGYVAFTAPVPMAHPWKGSQLGRPASGPGSMADPWRRLCAQLLDALIVLPATIGLIIVAVWMVWSNSAQKTFATVVWLELAVALAVLASYVVLAIYEAITTARWGRSPGKAVMDIRPVCVDGSELGWGRSFGRAFAYSLARLLSVLWLLDVLWCLWDENSQCLHDKVCDTIVVND